MSIQRPVIGVFDSGFGGLTVLREIVRLIPNAEYLYFGDTARLPYGTKSVDTVARYALEACHFLESQGAAHLVIACNTATALAMDAIKTSSNDIAKIIPGKPVRDDATRPERPIVQHFESFEKFEIIGISSI